MKAWPIHLADYSNMCEENVKLRRELLSEKKPELDDLEKSQPIYIARDAKTCSRESARGVAGQPCAGEIRHLIHGSYNG